MDEKKWAFRLDQEVYITRSNETGKVEGRAEYEHAEDQFYVEYLAADGRAVNGWFRADELRAC